MTKILTQFIWVFLGGGVGSCLRLAISILIQPMSYSHLISLGLVNILGGVGAGYIMSSYSESSLGYSMKLIFMTGLLGGFTTFSAFSYELYQLITKSQYWLALGFIICVFFGSVLGVFLGHKF